MSDLCMLCKVYVGHSLCRNVEADVDLWISRCPVKRLVVLLSKDKLERWLAE